MNSLKTYRHVNKINHELNFSIFKMEAIHKEKKGIPDEPHRHDFYTLLLIKQAEGKHIIDFNEWDLSSSQIAFIKPGQVHQLVEYEKTLGYSMLFSSQFLIERNISNCFLENLNLYEDTRPLTLNSEELGKLMQYADEIFDIHTKNESFKNEAIGALLKLILIRCNNLCSIKKEVLPALESGNALLRDFKELINQKHESFHATTDYASALNITPDHLNRVVKSLTGKTAKAHIQYRIVIAAKRLLYFTELTNKEIGYQLGFSEPANFSAFFKKHEGTSPSKFKKNF